MYALYDHPRYFNFKEKYQQYDLCFQTIFPFLMTILDLITRDKAQLSMGLYWTRRKLTLKQKQQHQLQVYCGNEQINMWALSYIVKIWYPIIWTLSFQVIYDPKIFIWYLTLHYLRIIYLLMFFRWRLAPLKKQNNNFCPHFC